MIHTKYVLRLLITQLKRQTDTDTLTCNEKAKRTKGKQMEQHLFNNE